MNGDLILICMDTQAQLIRTYIYDDTLTSLSVGNTI